MYGLLSLITVMEYRVITKMPYENSKILTTQQYLFLGQTFGLIPFYTDKEYVLKDESLYFITWIKKTYLYATICCILSIRIIIDRERDKISAHFNSRLKDGQITRSIPNDGRTFFDWHVWESCKVCSMCYADVKDSFEEWFIETRKCWPSIGRFEVWGYHCSE